MKKLLYLSTYFIFFLASCSLPNSGEFSIEPNPTNTGNIYEKLEENPFVETETKATSTFSIDADGASYGQVRRMLMKEKIKPIKAAIRTEELINYFPLDYVSDNTTHPITLNGEVSSCPWNKENKLIRIGIKGKSIADKDLPASNFVFLIDVSGSMNSEDKLQLLKKGFNDFVEQMTDKDKIAIVTYAGAEKIVLPSTSGKDKAKIKNAIDKLGAGGGTAGSKGIITAYEIAQENLIKDGNNRIILGTDGDFNIGITDQDELIKLIETKRDLGIFLTVLGVGFGNLNDATLEQLADKGNGTYEYIDDVKELKKVFLYEKSKFFTVAKDVKIQVEFNPEIVKSYRLIGYENRALTEKDFTDDKKDAGEIGANQNITALYEIIPKNNNINARAFKIDCRYKEPNSDISVLMELNIFDKGNSFEQSSDFMKLCASITSFAMLLTDSKYKGDATYDKTLEWIKNLQLSDNQGYINEFKQLVGEAKKY